MSGASRFQGEPIITGNSQPRWPRWAKSVEHVERRLEDLETEIAAAERDDSRYNHIAARNHRSYLRRVVSYYREHPEMR